MKKMMYSTSKNKKHSTTKHKQRARVAIIMVCTTICMVWAMHVHGQMTNYAALQKLSERLKQEDNERNWRVLQYALEKKIPLRRREDGALLHDVETNGQEQTPIYLVPTHVEFAQTHGVDKLWKAPYKLTGSTYTGGIAVFELDPPSEQHDAFMYQANNPGLKLVTSRLDIADAAVPSKFAVGDLFNSIWSMKSIGWLGLKWAGVGGALGCLYQWYNLAQKKKN